MMTAEFGPTQKMTTDEGMSAGGLLTVHETLTASAGARLRDLRKNGFRRHSVLRQRRADCRGTPEHKIADPTTPV